MTDEQTFENYRNRLDIRDVLEDAGYTLYKRDGLRYPAYVRLDSDGRRISGDKYLVSPVATAVSSHPQSSYTPSPPSFGSIQTSSQNTSKVSKSLPLSIKCASGFSICL